tara:strand:+ start:2840 stop:4186 length:1347 start_codon:yes stop_codon:yes gene_type:complete
MAIAPVNKFVSIAVPISPGLQKLYEVPTGTSALLLYTQVSNVAVGVTFPKVTFIQRRESRSTGNTRDVRVIKEVEIPPNDAVILVDGRLVLEKTPKVVDRIFVEGKQQNVGIITGVLYDEPTGIATVFTKEAHGFGANDPITLAGIAFTCSGSTGITTTIFPDPMQSYTVDLVNNNKEFSTVVGGSKGYPHFYNSAIHFFERARDNAIEVVTGTGGYTLHTAATGTTYDPSNGDLVVTTASAHNFSVGDFCRIDDNGITFTCSKDSHGSNHPYPRSTDPASGKLLTVTAVSGTATFTVNVGASSPSDQYTHTFVSGVANAIKKVNTRFNVLESQYNGGPNPKEVIFENNPLTLNVGEVALSLNVNHGLSGGNKIRIVDNSLIYTCTMDNRATEHSYPRSTDPASNVELQISTTGTKSFRVNVGPSLSGGFFAPLEMELIASVLENSTA